ncbi:hypothetical protein CEK71_16325 [Methylovulum psychrotolerans]|uniref:Uncharacterized protein n=2 Tax=Methylovulum psychrotolerans TaxID=1704499 RepID=A0A1Z4C1V1_9GAMM|nr:hypothetical protein CEK71_16325 [Methylovulum psychrotolerans]
MLVLRCPILQYFKHTNTVLGVPMTERVLYDGLKLSDLGIPHEMAIDADGDQRDLVHKWERIPSSLSYMAFKVFVMVNKNRTLS